MINSAYLLHPGIAASTSGLSTVFCELFRVSLDSFWCDLTTPLSPNCTSVYVMVTKGLADNAVPDRIVHWCP